MRSISCRPYFTYCAICAIIEACPDLEGRAREAACSQINFCHSPDFGYKAQILGLLIVSPMKIVWLGPKAGRCLLMSSDCGSTVRGLALAGVYLKAHALQRWRYMIRSGRLRLDCAFEFVRDP